VKFRFELLLLGRFRMRVNGKLIHPSLFARSRFAVEVFIPFQGLKTVVGDPASRLRRDV